MAVAEALPRLELIWADSAYLGPLQTWVWETCGWRLEIVERPGGRRGGGWMREGQEAAARGPGGPAARRPGLQAPARRRGARRTLAWGRARRRSSKHDECLAVPGAT